MVDFFGGVRPGTTAILGDFTFELPILYFRDDAFLLLFTANPDKVKKVMPSNKLHPVIVPGGKALIGVAAFNYIDTSIGPYGEVAVAVPAVYGEKTPPMGIPALLESRYSGYGLVVAHLPVTNTLARDGGRSQWGYPKFVGDMHFTITPEFMECRLSEEKNHILTCRVARGGMFVTDKKPLVTYTVKDRNLVKTTIKQKGSCRMSFKPNNSFLLLGHHPVAEWIREMDISSRPLLSRYYVERNAILPQGRIIESDVGPLEGYYGRDREGEHQVVYMG